MPPSPARPHAHFRCQVTAPAKHGPTSLPRPHPSSPAVRDVGRAALRQLRRQVRGAWHDEQLHLGSGCMPSFVASDARLYWAAADCHERSNAHLFRSLTAALPLELRGTARSAAELRSACDGGRVAVHARGSTRGRRRWRASWTTRTFTWCSRAGERRGGAGAGGVVPAGGASAPEPGIRGPEEDRAHETGASAAPRSHAPGRSS